MKRTDPPVTRHNFVVIRGGLDLVTVDGSHLPAGIELRIGHELNTARCWLTVPEAERLVAALMVMLRRAD